MKDKYSTILGALIASAVGDALGLHREGMTARRGVRMFPNPDRYYFLGNRGATSGDYDHASMTVEAFCASGGDPDAFARELARRIRVWAACVPGGIGLATLRSSLKLWLGVSPTKSGVFSAGNGPAMRSHVLGALSPDTRQLVAFVRASTLISHSDPKAFVGALWVALASRYSASAERVDPRAFLGAAKAALALAPADLAFTQTIEEAVESVCRGEATQDFARRFGRNGVSGYIYHTVPVVIHAWLSHPEDLPTALKAVIACGGDSDTAGSILGGIIGARVGIAGIPEPLVQRLILWPRGMAKAKALAELSESGRTASVRVPAWQYVVRNLWFDTVVLAHGLRRLGPPY